MDKENLKERSLEDIEGVLEELRTKLKKESCLRDTILLLIGRLKDINNSEKLYEIVKFAIEKEEGILEKTKAHDKILDFYSMNINRIRASLFANINEMTKDDIKFDK